MSLRVLVNYSCNSVTRDIYCDNRKNQLGILYKTHHILSEKTFLREMKHFSDRIIKLDRHVSSNLLIFGILCYFIA